MRRFWVQEASRHAHLVSIALEVVVEGELGAGRDVLQGKQADSQLPVHQPLLRLAVGRTAVVDEPAQASLHT